jgi:hypothetical protein
MLEFKDLVSLAKAAIGADKSAPVAYSYEGKNFSYNQVNDTLREELNELVGSPAKYRDNKNVFFRLVEETIGEKVPAKVAALYENLAEVKTFAQGEKPVFKRRNTNARIRAKQFITKVGLEGVYEVFKLGGVETFEVPTSAIGGAGQIGLEELLDGRVDFAEIIDIVMEGMEDRIQEETAKAMIAGINQLPVANSVDWNGFDEQEFDRLLTIADAYGNGKATIYCDFMFAAKLMPADINRYSDSMKNELWERGHFSVYKNHPVVILPNGLEDNTNVRLALDPSYCWIIPNSGVKPIRIAFEGETLTDDRKNADWSTEIQVYKKVGVAALFTNDICVYHDKSLSQDLVAKAQN